MRVISWRRSTHPPNSFGKASPTGTPPWRGFVTRFRLVGLDWREDVVSDRGLCRPTDLAVSRGNPSKARERLGWVAKHKIADIVISIKLDREPETL